MAATARERIEAAAQEHGWRAWWVISSYVVFTKDRNRREVRARFSTRGSVTTAEINGEDASGRSKLERVLEELTR